MSKDKEKRRGLTQSKLLRFFYSPATADLSADGLTEMIEWERPFTDSKK